MARRHATLRLEELETRSLPSTSPLPPLPVTPANVRAELHEHRFDRFERQADRLLADLARDVADGGDVHADLQKLDALTDRLDQRVDRVVNFALRRTSPGADLKADLLKIKSLTDNIDRTVDTLSKAVEWDVAHHHAAQAKHDVTAIGAAVHWYEDQMDHAVRDLLHDLARHHG